MAESLTAFMGEPALRTSRKVLVAPSRQAGVALRAAMARETGGACALEVTTIQGLARRIVEAADPEKEAGILGPSTLAVQVACTLHAMEELEGRPLMRSASSITRSIAEARSAGLDVDGYRRLVRGDVGRIAAEAYRRLERDLRRAGRRDAAGQIVEATRSVGALPDPVLPDVLLVLDAVELSGVAHRLLEAVRARISGAFVVHVPFPGLRPPDVAAISRLEWPTLSLDAAEAPLTFVEAVGAESEVRAVVRVVAERGLSLDAVEIAYPGHHPYVAMTREVLGASGLDATWAAGIAATDTRPGQAVRAWLGWLADGMPSAGLSTMLRAGLTVIPGEGDALSLRLAASLDRVRIGRGAPGYRAALRGDDFDRLAPLLELAPAGGLVEASGLARAAVTFVERFAPAHVGDEPERVADELVTRLRELGDADGTAPLRRLATRFAGIVDEMFLQARAARPGALHVVPLSGAGHTGRPHLVVLGLDQGSFGSSRAEDSLIPDDRRREAASDGSAILPQSAMARERSAWWLARAMARASGSVTIVRSTYDPGNDADLYPATPWLELRARHPQAPLERHLARPSNEANATGRATTLTEVLVAARRDPSTRRHVDLLHPALARGELAIERAAGEEWTAYDGVVSVARDPLLSARPVSPSRLEDLAACPFRYFLRVELGIRPPETRDDEIWIRPDELGTLIHTAFERTVRAWIRDGRPPAPDVLHAALEAELGEFMRVSEPPGAAVEQRIRRALEAAARILLHDADAARREGRTPVEVEFAFGGAEPASGGERSGPYVLDLDGLSIPLSGIVDRLDRLPDGRLVVIDYKSGSARGYTERALGDAGTRLQWALYALATEDLFGSEVARSGYLFVRDTEVGLSLFMVPPDRRDVAGRLRELAALPVLGHFPQAADSGACSYCDYRRVCGDLPARKEQIDSKIEATDETTELGRVLDRWRKRARAT